MKSQKEKTDPYAALRIREFLLFLNTRFFLTLGIQMQSVIVGWQVYEHTHDELSLGMIGLAEAIPFIIVSLFSGHVADTVSRKRIVLMATSLLLVSTSALLYFSMNNSAFIHAYGIAPIFFVIGFTGVVRGFISAALPAFVTQLVPRSLYANSASWNSSVWHVAAVIGPPVGGFICVIGFSAAYAVNLFCIALAIFSFAFIKSKPLPAREQKEGLRQSLSAGIKFVFNNQLVLGAISLDLFAVLFGGAIAVLPAYADKVLFADAAQLGFLRAAPAVGAVITAIMMAYRPPGKYAGRNLFLCVGGFGVATIMFAYTTNFYLAFFFLFLAGAFDNVSVVIRHTILQLSTPDNMRGRVSAVNSIFIGSSNEIGAFESGLAARLMGLEASVAFGGIMTVIIVSITARFAPRLRKLNLNNLT